jgi:hypothetical protein
MLGKGKVIDKSYDELLKVEYYLIAINFKDLKDIVRSWYEGIDFAEFDERATLRIQPEFSEMKRAGIICNFFFVYQEGDEHYLLDGFNRLLTDYGEVDVNQTVYVRLITDTLNGILKDGDITRIMFHLNTWKLFGRKDTTKINDYIDRGFRLLLYKKYGITIWKWGREKEDYENKSRYEDDVIVLTKYIKNESEVWDMYVHTLDNLYKLFSNNKSVEDISEILNGNDYKVAPFKNYNRFLRGYAMFLNRVRISGNEDEHKLETYIDILKKDTKFFKKLQGMSGNDHTRKNIYKFFRNIEKNL